MLRNTLINLTLKIGLMISLLYGALASFIVPATVVSYWPTLISRNLSESFLSTFTGIAILIYMAMIIYNRRRFYTYSSLSFFILAMILLNIRNVQLLFNMAPILAISLGLSLRYYPRVRVVAQTKVTTIDEEGEIEIAEINRKGDLIPSEKEHDQHLFVSGD